MAKATIAVAVLALTMLLAGPVAAAHNRRLLQGANASATGFGSGSGTYSKGGSFNNAATVGGNPLFTGAAAGGASYGVGVVNGKPSISTAFGEGTSLSINGFGGTPSTSSSQAGTYSTNNGNKGSSAGETINIGSTSPNGKAASQVLAAAQSLGKGK